MTAPDAERILLAAGFVLIRSKGSHRIFARGSQRVVIPYHAGRTLHPKIVKQVISAAEQKELP
jgi:predicted RNA binding protein YcfA (HicA-like mRNA interferase family)